MLSSKSILRLEKFLSSREIETRHDLFQCLTAVSGFDCIELIPSEWCILAANPRKRTSQEAALPLVRNMSA
jgi:hypothetical protein